MGPLAQEALDRLRASMWRKVNKRDEAALQKFIEDFGNPDEMSE